MRIHSYTSILFWVVWADSATRKPATLPKVIQSNVLDSAESQSKSHARFAIATNISFVMRLLHLAIVSLCSRACISFAVIFSLSEKSAGIGKLQSSKSLLILFAKPCNVADWELQSSMRFSMKQATMCSYPRSLPQGSGMSFDLHQFMYWACLNRSVSTAEPCLSLAIFASMRFPKSWREALDSIETNNNSSMLHGPVGVWWSQNRKREEY